jgi:hypothetical protein
VACRSYRPKHVRALRPPKGDHMIVFLCVSIKEIVERGRDFPWPRPEICPRCGSTRVWGHGFVSAIFDGFVPHVLLRRWRCPECHCVVRVRPGGYFSRFQASIETVRSSIALRLENGRWPPGGSRQRQGHWLRSLRRRVCAFFGQGGKKRLLEGFDSLMLNNEPPVCRRI